jgi:predicted nucleotidyltransferase
MVQREIEDIVIRFVNDIAAKGIKVEAVYLYGSYARGTQREDSDIDVAIISASFGKDRYEEAKILRQIAWRIDPKLEPVPLSYDAFMNDDWVPLVHEIKTKGTKVDIAA